MKIVHVICSLCTGGAELLLIDIVRCQSQAGHDVSLVIINNMYEDELCHRIPPEVRTVFVNRPQGSRNPWWIAKYNFALRRLKPDVIHFHHDAAVGMLLPGFVDAYKAVTIHDTGIELSHYHKVDRVLAISDAVKADLSTRYGINALTVYNGINTGCISKAPKRQLQAGHLSVLQISRLDAEKKGQDLLINAVPALKKEGYGLTVDFIGDGESYGMLKDMTKTLGLEDSVRFLGNKPRDYVYTHLADYDLLVQPSRYEGFGLTIAEGMAAKIPVLVSDIEGPLEVIGGGRYGHSFTSGSVDSLVSKIKLIYDNYDKVMDVAQNDAYDHCLSNFSVETTARKYVEKYSQR